MKLSASTIVFLMFAANITYGAGYGGAMGVNRLGQTVRIGDDGRTYRISVKQNKQDNNWSSRFDFFEECDVILDGTTGYWKEFVCKKDGKSPLAGATYKVIRNPDMSRDCSYDSIYKCIDGCDEKRVPLEIVEGAWECMQDVNTLASGVVERNNVNLRDSPGLNSTVLRTIARGTNVRVQERVKVDGTKGEWAKVIVDDGNAIHEGWMFNEYITTLPTK